MIFHFFYLFICSSPILDTFIYHNLELIMNTKSNKIFLKTLLWIFKKKTYTGKLYIKHIILKLVRFFYQQNIRIDEISSRSRHSCLRRRL